MTRARLSNSEKAVNVSAVGHAKANNFAPGVYTMCEQHSAHATDSSKRLVIAMRILSAGAVLFAIAATHSLKATGERSSEPKAGTAGSRNANRCYNKAASPYSMPRFTEDGEWSGIHFLLETWIDTPPFAAAEQPSLLRCVPEQFRRGGAPDRSSSES